MTLDIKALLKNLLKKQMSIQHFTAKTDVFGAGAIPKRIKDKIKEEFGEQFLLDANYVVFFRGDINKEGMKKLFNLTNKAFGEDANRLVEGDFKKISFAATTSNDAEVDDETPAEQEYTRNLVESLIQLAAEEVEKNRGTIPGEMLQKIEKIRQKPRPVTDWKRYFRRYLGNEFTDLIRKSKKRESKRFPDAAGNRHQRKSYILVAVDTSGSICMPEYKEFFGQIKTLSETASFHVVECDSTIQHEYEFTGLIPETVHGDGGTDFQPVITLFNNNRRKYDALVYFTDGYSDIPNDTPKETLWVISSDGNHDRQRYRKNGASVVFIPKKQ